ncbi:MAG: hypothetical protein JNL50_14115 [Phycisphaerae bacterium]|nr:hypothetical protein [Phycisphaerae bacterium]
MLSRWGLSRWGLVLLVFALAALGGCGSLAGVRLTSVARDGGTLDMRPRTLAYSTADRNTADVYLTDLPAEVLDPGADLKGVSGQLVHIHLFITPEAGATPIDSTACSASVRHVVIADGRVGVYGGGGFLAPSTSPGDRVLAGKLRDATLRLTSAGPEFSDRLGASKLNAAFRAPLDPRLANALAARLDTILANATPR